MGDAGAKSKTVNHGGHEVSQGRAEIGLVGEKLLITKAAKRVAMYAK